MLKETIKFTSLGIPPQTPPKKKALLFILLAVGEFKIHSGSKIILRSFL